MNSGSAKIEGGRQSSSSELEDSFKRSISTAGDWDRARLGGLTCERRSEVDLLGTGIACGRREERFCKISRALSRERDARWTVWFGLLEVSDLTDGSIGGDGAAVAVRRRTTSIALLRGRIADGGAREDGEIEGGAGTARAEG